MPVTDKERDNMLGDLWERTVEATGHPIYWHSSDALVYEGSVTRNKKTSFVRAACAEASSTRRPETVALARRSSATKRTHVVLTKIKKKTRIVL